MTKELRHQTILVRLEIAIGESATVMETGTVTYEVGAIVITGMTNDGTLLSARFPCDLSFTG